MRNPGTSGTLGTPEPSLFRPDVFEVDRLALDSALRRRDVVREPPDLVERRVHDAQEIFLVGRRWEPLVLAARPFPLRQHPAGRIDVHADELADAAGDIAIG